MSTYLTPEAFKRLKAEFHELMDRERPKIVELVSWAASLGDRSENADYLYGKKRLREIDRRIRFLSKKLESSVVVDPATVNTDKVSFGCWVEVLDEEERHHHYQIVGEDEIDPARGRITFSSPVGRALLGKGVGAVVTVTKPGGPEDLEILNISTKAPKQHGGVR